MVSLHDAAVLGIHLVGILLLRGVELQDVAGLARIAAQLLSGEHDFLCSFIKSGILQGDLLRLLQRDEVRCHDLFLLLLQHSAQHRINAVCPLCFRIGKDEPVVRRFDAAAHKGFLGKADFILASGIIQSDFLRFGKSDKFPGINNAAALCVDLVEILIRPGVELQQVAGLALIAVQLLSGEHDLLCGLIKSRVFQGNLLCFFQRDEICSVDFRCGGLFLLFLQNDTQHRINAVCPLCFCIGKDEPVVRRFDAAAHKGFLGKADFILASGIIQSDFLRFGKSDKFPGINNAAALCVDLVEILIRPGVELQQVAGLSLIAAQLLSGEHDLLHQLIKLRVLQRNLLCFLQGDELRYTDRRSIGRR